MTFIKRHLLIPELPATGDDAKGFGSAPNPKDAASFGRPGFGLSEANGFLIPSELKAICLTRIWWLTPVLLLTIW